MRPIDADKLDGRKLAVPDWLKPDERTRGWNECIEYIKKAAPTLDVAPVRRGRLASTGFDEIYCEWGDCSVCGADNRISAKFCNNCGAKLEEGAQE